MNRLICYCSLLSIALSSISCKTEVATEPTPEQLKVITVSPPDGWAYFPLSNWVYIDFNTPLDTNNSAEVFSKVRITPSVDHFSHFLYESLGGIRIEPVHDFSPNTTYRIEIDSSLKAKNGTILGKTFSTLFHTGFFQVLYTNPPDMHQVYTRGTQISISFTGSLFAPPHSAPAGFSITPAATGGFSNSKGGIVFSPDSLEANTTYIVKVDSQITSIDQIHLQIPYTFSFRTLQR